MKTYLYPPRNEWKMLCTRPQFEASDLQETVSEIFSKVEEEGDQALRYFTKKFDDIQLNKISYSHTKKVQIDLDLEMAIIRAAKNIKAFHARQKPKKIALETMPGVRCEMLYRPLETAAIYIPGGTAPLFSTVLMLGIPALEAGVKNIYILTPPDKNGDLNPVIARTAQILGIKNVFLVGGAQAIAAAALGTNSIPQADIISGPGNQYVTAAKSFAQNRGVKIDMPAGPSELLVWADESCIPAFVASDLLSQAEHGTDSQVILLLNKKELIPEIQNEIKKQLNQLPRKALAGKALENSRIIVLESEKDQVDFVNLYAPEHLIICKENYQKWVREIKNAGSVFLGNYTPESAGDYASGTNHTLPTYGFAKNYSGVGLQTFMKSITVQEISVDGLKKLGPTIETMAEAELLQAHKNAISIRLNKLNSKNNS